MVGVKEAVCDVGDALWKEGEHAVLGPPCLPPVGITF